MTTHHTPSLEEQRLTVRAQALRERLERLDTAGDLSLELLRLQKLALTNCHLQLLLSGPNLTVAGWRAVGERLTAHEAWVERPTVDGA